MTTSTVGAGVHAQTLERAQEACRTRHAWSAFPERPDRVPGAEQAAAAGLGAFQARLGSTLELDQPTTDLLLGGEISPYTTEALGISYPVAPVDQLFIAAQRAMDVWREVRPDLRVELCLEIVARLYARVFELAHATMHTTGQSLVMSCVGSGTNALDRGIEAVAYAAAAMERVPSGATWIKDFGRTPVHLDKRYRIVPRGVAVVVTCASFPTWNAYPAILANLATGNPVIVKPHPTSVLTMALAVESCQEVLREAGLPASTVQLAPDSVHDPVTTHLVEHPDCAIVDFTGSPTFGSWVERNAHPAIAFTETAGVNTVVLHSVDDLSATAAAIAGSLGLFSAQMCTSVQNIYLPRPGLPTAAGTVSVEEVERAIVDATRALSADNRRAAAILGAVQSPSTLENVHEMTRRGREVGRVLLEPGSYDHPGHPGAWTCTPAILGVGTDARDLYGEERFGPVCFVISCGEGEDVLAEAIADVRKRGTIASHVYSSDPAFLERATAAYWRAGASVTCNLTGPMPLNFAAAYSDFHVTGLSPAGNACLTDEAFIAGRFRVVQSRRPAAPDTESPA